MPPRVMGRAKPRPIGKKPTSLNPTRVEEPGKLPPTKLREPAPIHSLGVKDKDPVRPVISRPSIPVKPLSQPFDERKVGGLPPRPVKPPLPPRGELVGPAGIPTRQGIAWKPKQPVISRPEHPKPIGKLSDAKDFEKQPVKLLREANSNPVRVDEDFDKSRPMGGGKPKLLVKRPKKK